MDWIKKNFEKFTLLLLSIALLGVSVLLFLNARGFFAMFDVLKQPVTHNNNVPPLDTKELDEDRNELLKPASWTGHEGSLFVSRRYVVVSGTLVDPLEGDTGTPIHAPVPNSWFVKYHLEDIMLDSDALTEDPDGDGFTNLDEFNGGTDPLDKNSHPPYTTKLRLEKFINVPFRLVVKARPDADSFQIDTLDLHQPSQILHIGEMIQGTKFKLVKFEEKHTKDENDIDHDVSELTVQNVQTQEQVVLIMEKQVDSPDSYALFKYLWDNSEFGVKKGQEFSLKPEPDIKYKLIDINQTEALIQNLKTNEQIKIPLLEQKR